MTCASRRSMPRCASATATSTRGRCTETSARPGRSSGVKREDIFLTTKVWHDRQKAGDLERSVDESLERLKLPYVDLLLIHWPNKDVPLKETFDALGKVKRAGKTRHVGVANFTVAL